MLNNLNLEVFSAFDFNLSKARLRQVGIPLEDTIYKKVNCMLDMQLDIAIKGFCFEDIEDANVAK